MFQKRVPTRIACHTPLFRRCWAVGSANSGQAHSTLKHKITKWDHAAHPTKCFRVFVMVMSSIKTMMRMSNTRQMAPTVSVSGAAQHKNTKLKRLSERVLGQMAPTVSVRDAAHEQMVAHVRATCQEPIEFVKHHTHEADPPRPSACVHRRQAAQTTKIPPYYHHCNIPPYILVPYIPIYTIYIVVYIVVIPVSPL